MARFLQKLFTLKLEAATKKPKSDGVECLTCGHGRNFHRWDDACSAKDEDRDSPDFPTWYCECMKYTPGELLVEGPNSPYGTTAATKKPMDAEYNFCTNCNHSVSRHFAVSPGSPSYKPEASNTGCEGGREKNQPFGKIPIIHGPPCDCTDFNNGELSIEAATKKEVDPDLCLGCGHIGVYHASFRDDTHCRARGGAFGPECKCPALVSPDLPGIEAATKKKPKSDSWQDELVSECDCIRYRAGMDANDLCIMCGHPKSAHTLADESIPLPAGRPLDSCNGWNMGDEALDKEAATKKSEPDPWGHMDECLTCAHPAYFHYPGCHKKMVPTPSNSKSMCSCEALASSQLLLETRARPGRAYRG